MFGETKAWQISKRISLLEEILVIDIRKLIFWQIAILWRISINSPNSANLIPTKPYGVYTLHMMASIALSVTMLPYAYA